MVSKSPQKGWNAEQRDGIKWGPTPRKASCSMKNTANLIFHINARLLRLEVVQQIQRKNRLFNLWILCQQSSYNDKTAVLLNECLGPRTESTKVGNVVGGNYD